MLQRWIYEGELDDPFEEFFVSSDPNVQEEDLWRSKYSIRRDMQPTFISELLAKKVCIHSFIFIIITMIIVIIIVVILFAIIIFTIVYLKNFDFYRYSP